MAASEDELVRRAVLNDADALAQLLEAHGGAVAGSLDIARKWQPIVSADDVMQVTYLEAFLRIGEFQPSGNGSFGAWLRRIAQNNLKDALREMQRAKRPQPEQRVDTPGDRSYLVLVQQLAGEGKSPSGEAAVHEATRFVEEALGRVPEDYQTAIRLYELQGRSVREVAQAMGRSEGAVKMLLSRARDRLRDLLGSGSKYFSG